MHAFSALANFVSGAAGPEPLVTWIAVKVAAVHVYARVLAVCETLRPAFVAAFDALAVPAFIQGACLLISPFVAHVVVVVTARLNVIVVAPSLTIVAFIATAGTIDTATSTACARAAREAEAVDAHLA